MSDDARSDVLRQINRKIKQTNAAKYRNSNPSPHYTKVYDFFKGMEEVYKVAANNGEFQYLLSIEAMKLHEKLKTIDPDISWKMEWNDVDDWTLLRLQGITLTWSPKMLAQNPGLSQSEYIDITEMLIG